MIHGPVLVDAGPLVAVLAVDDQHHQRCSECIQTLPRRLVSCWPVVVEAAYLLRRSGVSLEPLLALIEIGHVELLPLGRADVPGINRIRQTYNDQDLDLADLCLIHLAEREDIQHVFTLDRRHFGAFRKKDGSALDLHP